MSLQKVSFAYSVPFIVQIASRFIQQFKETDSTFRSPVMITSVYIPEKLCKKKKYIKKSKEELYFTHCDGDVTTTVLLNFEVKTF